MRFLIEYESAHWAEPPHYCVVEAENAYEAEIKAEYFMHDHMWELFYDEYQDMDYDDKEAVEAESAHHVLSVVVFDENHEHWEFFTDPTQSEFYPEIE